MPTVGYELPSGLGPEEFSARIFGADADDDGDTGLDLVPFTGVRFDPDVVGDLGRVTTPPYDLIDEEGVRRLRASDVHNIVRLILPERDPAAPEAGYETARRTLGAWLTEGALRPDPTPALYVYEESAAGEVVQRGLIGAVALRPESAGVILPHENVFPGPVVDRLALMSATEANLEPIFLLYDGARDAARVIDKTAETAPVVQMQTEDGLLHRLWRLDSPDVLARIAADLRGHRALIADGHHRYATYRALQARHHAAGDGPGPWDYGLALLVDSVRYPPHLAAIHRVLPGLSPEAAVERAKTYFTVTELPEHHPAAPQIAQAPQTQPKHPVRPSSLSEALAALQSAGRKNDGSPAFLLAGANRLWLLTDPDPAALAHRMPSDHSERWRRLDTAILDSHLIEAAWGITADEHSVDIVHHDAAAAIAKAHRTGGTAVILNPLQVDDVIAVAAGGERVPRKSTSFAPKPRTGLVLRLFNNP